MSFLKSSKSKEDTKKLLGYFKVQFKNIVVQAASTSANETMTKSGSSDVESSTVPAIFDDQQRQSSATQVTARNCITKCATDCLSEVMCSLDAMQLTLKKEERAAIQLNLAAVQRREDEIGCSGAAGSAAGAFAVFAGTAAPIEVPKLGMDTTSQPATDTAEVTTMDTFTPPGQPDEKLAVMDRERGITFDSLVGAKVQAAMEAHDSSHDYELRSRATPGVVLMNLVLKLLDKDIRSDVLGSLVSSNNGRFNSPNAIIHAVLDEAVLASNFDDVISDGACSSSSISSNASLDELGERAGLMSTLVNLFMSWKSRSVDGVEAL